METILKYIESLRYNVATQKDSQKMMLTAGAMLVALLLFFGGLGAFYWDGGNYIISTDGNHLEPKKETHSGHNTEDPTNAGSEKKDQEHGEVPAH